MRTPSSWSEMRAPTFSKHNYYQARRQNYNFSIVASLNVYDADIKSVADSKRLNFSLNLSKY